MESPKTFLFCADDCPTYYWGKVTRFDSELTTELQRLDIGEYLATSESTGIVRES